MLSACCACSPQATLIVLYTWPPPASQVALFSVALHSPPRERWADQAPPCLTDLSVIGGRLQGFEWRNAWLPPSLTALVLSEDNLNGLPHPLPSLTNLRRRESLAAHIRPCNLLLGIMRAQLLLAVCCFSCVPQHGTLPLRHKHQWPALLHRCAPAVRPLGLTLAAHTPLPQMQPGGGQQPLWDGGRSAGRRQHIPGLVPASTAYAAGGAQLVELHATWRSSRGAARAGLTDWAGQLRGAWGAAEH